VKGEASEQISIDAIAKRIPAVRPTYKRVLACLSEGLSNTEIALKLGYKNERSVASTILFCCKNLDWTLFLRGSRSGN
jgi:DNA-binding NarL/FixJ family response regulator